MAFLCSATIILMASVIVSGHLEFPSYKTHPCLRECEEDGAPMTCEYDFTLGYYYTLSKACFDCPFNRTDCDRPDCVAADGVRRAFASVNRMMPGPAIQVCKGDMIVVNVFNKMEGAEGVTIHWHGVNMAGYQYHDGGHMITQCPITQQSEFQYRFKAANAGTHYWHAHTGFQRGDGIHGALIIREPVSRDPISHLHMHDLPEHVMLVQDWKKTLIAEAFAGRQFNGNPYYSNSMLINGKGALASFTDPDTNEETHTPYAVFNVRRNETFRFRVINNGVLKCPMQISVDNHMLVMVASDGYPFHPIVVDSFLIFNGERFDFILDADKDVGNYWIRVRGFLDCSNKPNSMVAILRYEGAEDVEPSEPTDYDSADRQGKLLNPLNTKGTVDMVPVSWLNSTNPSPPDLKQVPDKQFYLGLDFHPLYDYRYSAEGQVGYAAQVNRISNILPPSPLLSQHGDVPGHWFCGPQHNDSYCTDESCDCTHLLHIDVDDTVEMVIADLGRFSSNHPMHLHGQGFHVVAMDRVNETVTMDKIKQLDAEGNIYRNLDTPIMKDTVTVPDGGYTIIRFKADIPGYWHFHCHVSYHNSVGMGVILQVGDSNSIPKPPKDFPTCGNWKYHGEQEVPPPQKPCPSSGHSVLHHHVSLMVVWVMLCYNLLAWS